MLREIIFTVLIFTVNCLIIQESKLKNDSEIETLFRPNSLTNSYENNTENDSFELWYENYQNKFMFDDYQKDEDGFYIQNLESRRKKPRKTINNGKQPTYYDWRDRGSVSPVKSQGECGACWAFSVIANIESHIKIYFEKKETLSEQFLIDCDDNSHGCTSASLLKTFANIVANFNGVLRQQDYPPYEAQRSECRWDGNPPPIPVVGFRRIKQNEELMAEAVFKNGPLSAAINSDSMNKYKGNFIDEPTEQACSSKPDKLDHAVLIVGYNVYVDKTKGKTVPYWIIKNSWGENWGDKGYYYLVRGRNACGIANDVSFAFVN